MRRFSLVQFLPRSSLIFSYTILVGSSGRDCESQCIVIRPPITPIAAAGGFGDVRQIRNPSFFSDLYFFTHCTGPALPGIDTNTDTYTNSLCSSTHSISTHMINLQRCSAKVNTDRPFTLILKRNPTSTGFLISSPFLTAASSVASGACSFV